MTVSGYPTQRSAGGFRRSAPTRNPNPFNKGVGFTMPVSKGELVPYQSGPRGSSTAPAGTANPYNTGRGTGYGLAKFGGRVEAGLRRGAAVQRALARAGALGRTVSNIWDLYELLSREDALGWYQTPRRFNHPANAELLEDCHPVTCGPHQEDGDCTIINTWFTDPDRWCQPAWTETFNAFHWRYHEFMGFHPFGGNILYRKAQRWRSLKATGGHAPGAMEEGRTLPSPVGLPAPQIGVRGGVRTPTGTPTANATRRPDEKKKGLAQRGYALASVAYGTADEARQAVDVLFKCLPGGCKAGIGRGTLARAGAIARCAGSLDIECAAEGLLINEIEDRIIGRAQGATSKASHGLRGGIGSAITGPAL